MIRNVLSELLNRSSDVIGVRRRAGHRVAIDVTASRQGREHGPIDPLHAFPKIALEDSMQLQTLTRRDLER